MLVQHVDSLLSQVGLPRRCGRSGRLQAIRRKFKVPVLGCYSGCCHPVRRDDVTTIQFGEFPPIWSISCCTTHCCSPVQHISCYVYTDSTRSCHLTLTTLYVQVGELYAHGCRVAALRVYNNSRALADRALLLVPAWISHTAPSSATAAFFAAGTRASRCSGALCSPT